MTPDMNTAKIAYNDAPSKIDIEFMVEQIAKLSNEKQIRLLKILIERNYIGKEVMQEGYRWK